MKPVVNEDYPYIFVSYARDDKETVRPIVEGLMRNACNIWFDDQLHNGNEWHNIIFDRLEHSKYFLCFLSDSFVNSPNCREELLKAHELNIPIIPIALSNVMLTQELDDILHSLHRTNIYDSRYENSTKTEILLDILNGLRNNCRDVFLDNHNNLILSNEKKDFYIEKTSTNLDVIRIVYKDKETNENGELFSFTSDRDDIKIKIGSIKGNQNEEGLNSPYHFSVSFIFETSLDVVEGACIEAVVHFTIVDPLLLEPRLRVIFVEIISPSSGLYEYEKTIDELKGETNHAGQRIIELIHLKLFPKSKSDDTATSCLDKENKDADLITVRQLLSNSRQNQICFRIPDYQRGYAWDSENEFDDLWNDIMRVYSSGLNNKKHYTGMLSLDVMDPVDKTREGLEGQNAFYVTDGQQRLTSIIIILYSIYYYLKEQEENSAWLDELFNELFPSISATHQHRFNYSVKRDSQAKYFFEKRIYENNNRVSPGDSYLINIDNAKRKTDSELLLFEVDEVKRLLNIVLDQLIFNIYFVSIDFDVRLTFETMNSRGKGLTNLETLKNRLMYLSSFFPSEHSYGNQLINMINDTWSDIYRNLSYSDYQLPDDDYLETHWHIYHRIDKSYKNTYIESILKDQFSIDRGEFHRCVINKQWERAFQHINRYVISLRKYSKYWRIINRPDECYNLIETENNNLENKKLEAEWLLKLFRIPSTDKYVKSAILAVCGDDHLSHTNKIRFYQELEKYIFINKVIAKKRGDFSPIVTDIRDLLLDKTSNEKVVILNNVINKLQRNDENGYKVGEGSIENKINNFVDIILGKKQYFYDWDGIMYFLFEYDARLRATAHYNVQNVPDFNKKKEDSIEHILPQTHNRPYWSIALTHVGDDDLPGLINSIGNLLLLSMDDNRVISNFSYPIKRHNDFNNGRFSYHNGSASAQEIASDNHYDYWSAEQIYYREGILFNFMYDRWFNGLLARNEFHELIANLYNQPFTLSEDVKQQLDALTFDDETYDETNNEVNVIKESIKSGIRQEFERNGYVVKFYDIKPNFKDAKERIYKFKVSLNEENRLTSIIAVIRFNNHSYKFTYKMDDNSLCVEYRDEENNTWMVEGISEEQLHRDSKYFIRLLKRYLAKYYPNASINLVSR